LGVLVAARVHGEFLEFFAYIFAYIRDEER